MPAKVKIKRIYEDAEKSDGFRILVDRIWPRGVSKADANVDLWLKEIAPSTELRKWFAHDAAKWKKFCERYAAELKKNDDTVKILRDAAKENKTITLVYSARDTEHNQAVVLRDVLFK